jgi:hypothetical protein
MTMLDDDRLAALFAQAAEAFAVPSEGASAIVARATSPATTAVHDVETDEPDANVERTDHAADDPVVSGRVRRLADSARRHPLRAAAACLLVALVAAGTVGAVARNSTPSPTLTSGLPHGAPLAPGGSTAQRSLTPSGSSVHGASGAPAFGAQANGAKGSTAAGTAVTTPTVPSLPGGAVGQPAKIEQTGTLGLAVRRGALGHTMSQLSALATAYGGFVASSQTQSGAGSGGAPYGSVTLQVPVANFDAAVKAAQALGKTSSLTTKATDVTSQYVDLQSRIAALEESRQQYLTILSKATTVGDVLAVQTQLDAIQSQIEQLQGQLQVLASQTSYSTLAVTVTEGSRPAPPSPLPESGVVRAWHDSTDGFLAGVEGAIRIAGPVLFALLCLAALAFGGRALWRRYQRHNL